MIEIVIMRHALAQDRDEFAKTGHEDFMRPLVLKGRKRALRVCQHLASWGEPFDLIMTSPYVRAKQTAEIAKSVFVKSALVEVPELVPEAPVSAFLKCLKVKAKSAKRILVVGHEPHLSAFASWILAEEAESFIYLKKGGILSLKFESVSQLSPGTCMLDYLLPPKLLLKKV